MTKQRQHARRNRQSAEKCCGNRIDALKGEKAGHIFRQQRCQSDGAEGLHREGEAEAAEGEIIKRQIDEEEDRTKAEVGTVMHEERQTNRATRQKTGCGKQRDAERYQHAARKNALRVFQQRMTIRRGGPKIKTPARARIVHALSPEYQALPSYCAEVREISTTLAQRTTIYLSER